MRWFRHRGAAPTLDPRRLADTWQLVSLLLDYPDEQLLERIPSFRSVTATLPSAQREPLDAYLDHIGSRPLSEIQADYVDTFDVTRKCSLHLTYFTHGDTRRRGVALVEFRQAFRTCGVELDIDHELPDHLCVVLEFGALVNQDVAWRLLNRHRVGIELLRLALAGKDSPWLPVVDTLRSTLPVLDGDDRTALAKLIAEGPPSEDVGLDTQPYAMDPRLSEELNPRPEPLNTADLGPLFISSDIPVGGPR